MKPAAPTQRGRKTKFAKLEINFLKTGKNRKFVLWSRERAGEGGEGLGSQNLKYHPPKMIYFDLTWICNFKSNSWSI